MNKNYFLIFWGLLVLAFCNGAMAQQTGTTDVVYLKNGRTVRGTLLKVKAGKKLKLRTENGALYNLRFAEIDKLEKEETTSQNISESLREPVRKLRFTNIIELGYAGGKAKQEVNNIELKSNQLQSTARAQMVNGVQFGSRLSAGLGFGLDFYMTGEYLAMPLFIDVRGTTKTDGPIKPEALFSTGYSFGFNHRDLDKGLFASGGLGVKIKQYNNTALHLSLHYRFQQLTREEEYYIEKPGVPRNIYIPATRTINTTFNQFEVRIGHSF